MSIYNYNDVKKSFEDKKCIFLYTEEEFNIYMNEISQHNKNNSKRKFPKYRYIASCGCENIVYYNVFLNRETGVICPKCMTIKNAKNKKEENIGISNIKMEYDCIEYFKNLVIQNFEVIKCFDGCSADIAFKPLNIKEDIWCGIQVKTTNNMIRDYGFHLENVYDNLIILCICLLDKRIWAIPFEKTNNVKKLTIGLKKSKYNIYELTKENIINKLQDLYDNTKKYNFKILDAPKNIYQIREKEYRKYRESKLDFIKFISNNMEGLVYDFMIGNKKVQEKVGGLLKGKKSYNFCLYKNNGKINNNRVFKQYDIGDNDLYWLNCEGKKYFYVIPEKILIDNSLIGDETKKCLRFNPLEKNKWYNEYLFDYDNINKEKLLKLIE